MSSKTGKNVILKPISKSDLEKIFEKYKQKVNSETNGKTLLV